MKEIIVLVFFSIIFFIIDTEVAFSQSVTAYKYIGVEKCASPCHNDAKLGFQYNIWKISPHSKSYTTLASGKAKRYAKNAKITGNPQESEYCLKCHITAAGLDSSYITSTYRKEDGVTCEACHKEKSMTKTIIGSETDCLNCHNDTVHKMQKFNYKEKYQLIAHPRPKEIKEEK